MKYRVRIKSKNRKDAIAEGAERLGVDPSNGNRGRSGNKISYKLLNS